jgi:hypothetical protein
MDFSENEFGSNENLRDAGLSCKVVVCEPVMLPLLFLPKPKDIERRESIDWRGVSAPAGTAPDMLTGGYDLLGFSCFSWVWLCSVFLFPPNTEFVLLKKPPIVLDLLWPFVSGAGADPGRPAIFANLVGT